MCSEQGEASWDPGSSMATNVSPNSGLHRASALLEPLVSVPACTSGVFKKSSFSTNVCSFIEWSRVRGALKEKLSQIWCYKVMNFEFSAIYLPT